MHVRLFSAALTLPLVAGAALATAPTASAAAQCTLSAPAKVAIAKPYTVINLTAKGACTRSNGFATWDLVHSYYGPSDMALFDGTTKDTWAIYDWEHLGSYTWTPDWATDGDYNDQSQNSVRTSVRLKSYSAVSVSRKGSKVTVKTQTNRYGITARKTIVHAKAPSVIQYRTPGTSTWRNLKNVTSNSSGKGSYTYTSKAKRDYRLVTKDTSTVWGSTSATKRG